MSEPCCDANDYGFPCWCSAYKGFDQQAELDDEGDYRRDQQRDRDFLDEIMDDC